MSQNKEARRKPRLFCFFDSNRKASASTMTVFVTRLNKWHTITIFYTNKPSDINNLRKTDRTATLAFKMHYYKS
jgi:hypothetical protein